MPCFCLESVVLIWTSVLFNGGCEYPRCVFVSIYIYTITSSCSYSSQRIMISLLLYAMRNVRNLVVHAGSFNPGKLDIWRTRNALAELYPCLSSSCYTYDNTNDLSLCLAKLFLPYLSYNAFEHCRAHNLPCRSRAACNIKLYFAAFTLADALLSCCSGRYIAVVVSLLLGGCFATAASSHLLVALHWCFFPLQVRSFRIMVEDLSRTPLKGSRCSRSGMNWTFLKFIVRIKSY
jgi:hypothetical protein